VSQWRPEKISETRMSSDVAGRNEYSDWADVTVVVAAGAITSFFRFVTKHAFW